MTGFLQTFRSVYLHQLPRRKENLPLSSFIAFSFCFKNQPNCLNPVVKDCLIRNCCYSLYRRRTVLCWNDPEDCLIIPVPHLRRWHFRSHERSYLSCFISFETLYHLQTLDDCQKSCFSSLVASSCLNLSEQHFFS